MPSTTNKLAGLTADTAHAIAADLLERRRAMHGAARMDAGDTGGGGAGDNAAGTDAGAGSTDAGSSSTGGKTFTEAEVEALITRRLERDRAAADRKAQQANATEAQRIATLERELEEERTARRRSSIASKHNLGDLEDLLGSGTDDELEDRAKRLAGRLGSSSSSSSRSSSSSSTRTRRTVVETGDTSRQGLSAKERAVEALRSLGGNRDAD